MPHLLSVTAAKALAAPVETSLRQLLREYGAADDTKLLDQLRQLRDNLDHHQILCRPPIGDGGLDDARVLSGLAADSLRGVLTEISKLESSTVEFKSSFQIDRKRQSADPGRALAEYKSEQVLHSALKTIAAFANTGGGTLYLGVEDDGTIAGLAEDFCVADPKRADYDGWDQLLRTMVRNRFSEGQAMMAYLAADCFNTEEGLHFVRLRIAKRSRLTFLKSGDIWNLYIRTGTQTNTIPFQDIEEHFELRKLY